MSGCSDLAGILRVVGSALRSAADHLDRGELWHVGADAGGPNPATRSDRPARRHGSPQSPGTGLLQISLLHPGFLSTHHIVTIPFANVVLPLGISFFTFTQIGYLVDVKEGTARDRGLVNYAMFVTFFPHLIAGPILHNREIMPQFAAPTTYRLSGRNIAIGLSIFIIGLFKKTVLADPLSAGVGEGFSHSGDLAFLAAWHAALTYTLQLYFDFSGYSDMAIGLARMFNVIFPHEFRLPVQISKHHRVLAALAYDADALHQSLLVQLDRAGHRAGTDRRGARHHAKAQATIGGFLSMIVVPTFVTMTLIGIWHGAGLQFAVFGLLHSPFILSINHAWRDLPARRGPDQIRNAVGTLEHVASVLLTYLAVLIGMVFFRSSSVDDGIQMLAGDDWSSWLRRQLRSRRPANCCGSSCSTRSSGGCPTRSNSWPVTSRHWGVFGPLRLAGRDGGAI